MHFNIKLRSETCQVEGQKQYLLNLNSELKEKNELR